MSTEKIKLDCVEQKGDWAEFFPDSNTVGRWWVIARDDDGIAAILISAEDAKKLGKALLGIADDEPKEARHDA